MGENLYSDVRSALLTQPYDYCVYIGSPIPGIMGRLAENYNIHAKSPLITMSKGAKIYLDTKYTSSSSDTAMHPSSGS